MVSSNSKINTSSNQVSIVISYKEDRGSDGNTMPFHLCKIIS